MGKSKKHENKSKKKHKRKDKKKKSKKHLKEKKRDNEELGRKRKGEIAVRSDILTDEKSNDDFSIPLELMNSKSHAPETPEEYQQRQNRIRREIDPVTGRSRLIKGDGEVLEEIVSKERHKTINVEATKEDGDFFEENTLGKR